MGPLVYQKQSLQKLPFADPIIEDEQHVLLQCPQYEDLRSNLSSRFQEYLLTEIEKIFNDLWLTSR